MTHAPPTTRPVIALAALLDNLGHDCVSSCGVLADALRARVWFTVRHGAARARSRPMLVLVDTRDPDGSVTRSIELLRRINGCTTPDGIRVVERRRDDARLALAAIHGPATVTAVR